MGLLFAECCRDFLFCFFWKNNLSKKNLLFNFTATGKKKKKVWSNSSFFGRKKNFEQLKSTEETLRTVASWIRRFPFLKKIDIFTHIFWVTLKEGWRGSEQKDLMELTLCCPLVAEWGSTACLSLEWTQCWRHRDQSKRQTQPPLLNAAVTARTLKQQATRRRVAKDRPIPYKSSPCLRPPIQHHGPVLCCYSGGGGAHPNQATTQSSRHPWTRKKKNPSC